MAQTAEVQLKTVAEMSGSTSHITHAEDATSSATDSNFCFVRGTKNRCAVNYNLAPILDVPAGAVITAVHLRCKLTINGTIQRVIKLYSDANHSSYAATDSYASYASSWQTSTNNSTSASTYNTTIDTSTSNGKSLIDALNADRTFFTTEGKFVIGFNINNNSSSTSTNYRQCIWFCYVYLEYTVPQYVITTSTDGHGTITAGGTYSAGTALSITATPNESYKFSYFSISGDATQYTSNPLSVTVNGAKTITAYFLPKAVNITSVEVAYTPPLLTGEGAVVRCVISES